eukprot:TRINITY_DN74552_c0_g1_i1.p1 TRINITY_DN74552_c0_g1~~TRINITY_DN74552_c0_g1_i1.p1  ORF type:complete len:448 (-),score=109.04 TRINITY_DN74552_c0_g1_i1:273-1616(-)
MAPMADRDATRLPGYAEGGKRALSKLVVVQAGGGDVEELREHLDNTKVQWALVSFQLGSGSFQRRKTVFLHFNGDSCSPVKRGRLNSRTSEVQHILRERGAEGFHATVEFKRSDDVCSEALTGKVSAYFVSDNLGDHAKQWKVTQNAQRQPVEVDSRPPRLSTGQVAEPSAKRRLLSAPGTATSLAFETGRDALRAVADPNGQWQWVLIGPDPEKLPLIGGGSGSIEEMRQCVADRQDDVSFGLLRVSYGSGRLQRVTYAFVHAYGAKVSPVRRGKMLLLRPKMEEAVRIFVARCPIHIVDATPDQLTEEAIADRVRRACTVDDDEIGVDRAVRSRSQLQALREELRHETRKQPTAERKEPSREQGRRSCDVERRTWSVEEAVKLLHADASINWVLLELQESELVQRPVILGRLDSTSLVNHELAGVSPKAVTPKGIAAPEAVWAGA